VKHCSCVPPDVCDYFRRELNRTSDRKKTKKKERLLREEVAAEGNGIHDIDSNEEELQRALHASREEAQRERTARQRGGQYEHGGGLSQQQGVGLLGRFMRSGSQRAQTTQMQIRIDTGQWSTKGKQAKTAIGKAWAKIFHTEAIPGIKADNPYFVVMVKETKMG
jgi:hypothetical protein